MTAPAPGTNNPLGSNSERVFFSLAPHLHHVGSNNMDDYYIVKLSQNDKLLRIENPS